jgi:hypothetical protein
MNVSIVQLLILNDHVVSCSACLSAMVLFLRIIWRGKVVYKASTSYWILQKMDASFISDGSEFFFR